MSSTNISSQSMVSSSDFLDIVLCFTFQSMIHFELNFVIDIRSRSRLIFLCNIQFCFFMVDILFIMVFCIHIYFSKIK